MEATYRYRTGEINLIYFHFLGLEGAAALLCALRMGSDDYGLQLRLA